MHVDMDNSASKLCSKGFPKQNLILLIIIPRHHLVTPSPVKLHISFGSSYITSGVQRNCSEACNTLINCSRIIVQCSTFL